MTRNVYIGAGIPRREDARFLTGRGTYVGDLHPEGLLHAVILRSPVAHGRIVGVDVAAARAMHGVHAVFTAAEPKGAEGLGRRRAPVPGSWSPTGTSP